MIILTIFEKKHSMKKSSITIEFFEIDSIEELSAIEQKLIQESRSAKDKAYSPYSEFKVGAAVLLDNEIIIQGNNQENAAYPSGLCAERVALFYANSAYPNNSVKAIAITASNSNGIIQKPIAPCGSCRQVMLETEQRYNTDMKIYLVGRNKIYSVLGAKSLLPLFFDKNSLKLD